MFIYLRSLRLGITWSNRNFGSSVSRNYIVYGYVILASDRGVVSFLYNLCSVLDYVKTGFIKLYNWCIAPRDCRLEKRRRKEDLFLLRNQKNIEEQRRCSMRYNHLWHGINAKITKSSFDKSQTLKNTCGINNTSANNTLWLLNGDITGKYNKNIPSITIFHDISSINGRQYLYTGIH